VDFYNKVYTVQIKDSLGPVKFKILSTQSSQFRFNLIQISLGLHNSNIKNMFGNIRNMFELYLILVMGLNYLYGFLAAKAPSLATSD
jgi:hypothetical protein